MLQCVIVKMQAKFFVWRSFLERGGGSRYIVDDECREERDGRL